MTPGQHMNPGQHMRAEAAEAALVFTRTVAQEVAAPALPRAIYTIARGSSDAAANILSYEFMRELGLPMTSLPPSVFSVGRGVALEGAMALVVSQSGASEDLVLSARGARERGARVVGLINAPQSPVAAHADLIVPIGAGPELAVPATKSVVGAIAAGMALLGALVPDYRSRALTPSRRPRWTQGRCCTPLSRPATSMSSAATPAMARRKSWR